MNGGIVPQQQYEERPSQVVGELSIIFYCHGRMIGTIHRGGEVTFFEDTRLRELNTEIDRLRDQVTSLTTELEGTKAFTKATLRTNTKL